MSIRTGSVYLNLSTEMIRIDEIVALFIICIAHTQILSLPRYSNEVKAGDRLTRCCLLGVLGTKVTYIENIFQQQFSINFMKNVDRKI